ncbi:Fanconi anemia core complex-associated protein 24 [Lampris incognitus]|uniref:Fanconi anemia core complex-associated protein 24 n=1 Tax=Lampris incognitus TaxID=2546036 RepID=UPI0024B62BCE|nr:Fanconi anemia core complex-associated protein 24 [Lampris incognitus]
METKTPVLLNIVPPCGHVIASEKWRGTPLIQSLRGAGVKIAFDEGLDVVDFNLPNKRCILYVSECDIVGGNSYKRKLVRYRNANSSFQEMVLVERTRLSEQYFAAMQTFVVFDLGLTLLPVAGQTEASHLITQTVHGDSRQNPFRKRSVCRLYDPLVLAMVQQIPGVGKVKATALLQHFSSIHQLCNAGTQELEPIVGVATAQHIHRFFHSPMS